MIKVSVIIPVYNLENYIENTVESIKKQTLSDWELILVNDASSDNSLSILKKLEDNDNRIHVISYSENKGPMYAREQGCSISQGSYVTFCDGDDCLAEDALERMYNEAQNTHSDVVIGQFSVVYSDDSQDKNKIVNTLNYGNDRESFFRSVLLKEVYQGLAGKFFAKRIVKDAKLIIYEHCTMSEDAAVLFQYINLCNKASVIPDVVYYYYQRDNSSMHKLLTPAQIEGICKTSLLRMHIVEKYTSLNDEVNKYFIGNFISLAKYDYDGTLSRKLQEYNLYWIISLRNISKHYGIRDMIKIVVKRYYYPFTFSLKNKFGNMKISHGLL